MSDFPLFIGKEEHRTPGGAILREKQGVCLQFFIDIVFVFCRTVWDYICLFYLCIDLFLFVGLRCFCEVSWNFISVYFQPMTTSELSVT